MAEIVTSNSEVVSDHGMYRNSVYKENARLHGDWLL
jgi:hypothetical protein